MGIIQWTNLELKKIYQYKKNFYLNIVFVFLSLVIQLCILSVFFNFYEDKNLWYTTVLYSILSGSLNVFLSINQVPEFAESIKKGDIVKYFLRPYNVFHQTIFQEIGNSINASKQAIFFVIIAIIFTYIIFGTITNLFLFILTSFLSIILSILMTNSIYSVAFVTTNYGGIKAIFQGVCALLSGSIVPAILWPDNMYELLKFSPFILLVDFPIQVYLNPDYFWKLVGAQIFWIILFYFLGIFLFQFLQKHCDITGG